MAELCTVPLGGKGSSFSSSTISTIVASLAHFCIDKSTLDRLSVSSSSQRRC
ncbi:hypothetical protein AHAS_Ahas05G0282700 [Arachis hypogaea]